MSDYSFMRSGIGAPTQTQQLTTAEQLDIATKVTAVMECLLEDAMRTAARFTACCGRSTITAEDTVRALKYEAHEFFSRQGLEERFARALQFHLSGEEEDEPDSEPEDDEEPAFEVYTERFTTGSADDAHFHGKVLDYSRNWDGWQPTDPMLMSVKRAIDSVPLFNSEQ